MSDDVPAGWYPNPENPAEVRWWDGTQWTARTQPHPSAPAPGGTAPPQLGGRSFSTWVWLGLLGGVAVILVSFFATLANWFLIGGMTGWVLVLVAGIVLVCIARTRGLGVGLLISAAAGPIVLFGVCVVVLSAGGL